MTPLGMVLVLATVAIPRDIELEVTGCQTRLSQEELADALRLETRSVGPQASAFLIAAQPIAQVRCEGEQLTVEVSSSRSGVIHREVLRPQHLGLARFIAIAIVEGVSAYAETLPVRSPAPRSLWLHARGGAALMLWPSGELSLGASGTFHGNWGWSLTASGTLARLLVAQGSLHAITASLCAAVRLRGQFGRLGLDAGAGLIGGAIVWRGTASSPEVIGKTASAPWLGPAVLALTSLELAEWVRVELELSGAWLALSSSALAGQDAIAHLGPFRVSLQLGIGFRL